MLVAGVVLMVARTRRKAVVGVQLLGSILEEDKSMDNNCDRETVEGEDSCYKSASLRDRLQRKVNLRKASIAYHQKSLDILQEAIVYLDMLVTIGADINFELIDQASRL